ncbi:Flp family type IVb pilin [Hydrogenophaga sp.]|uniref:Flp family type IVb pilin n=1 Tax=Hydrogenophaga sp. TaxID=1904254 RepID=UPI002606CB1E|nr:Flp family type IVb pilin [Hydrogenophaga sp.]MCW5652858.1 Flp family type IVb pilin [Hydrogenophaga sp.]
MKLQILQFLRDEEGATAIEYGIIAGLMAIVLVVVFSTGENSVKSTLEAIFEHVKSSAVPSS